PRLDVLQSPRPLLQPSPGPPGRWTPAHWPSGYHEQWLASAEPAPASARHRAFFLFYPVVLFQLASILLILFPFRHLHRSQPALLYESPRNGENRSRRLAS